MVSFSHTSPYTCFMNQMHEKIKDAAANPLIERLLPAWFIPFSRLARWDRPIGTWLLLLPCWWGVLLGNGDISIDLWIDFLLFALGAFVMRGAGCTFNDIIDCEIDKKVARTATRPLPAGDVSLYAAWMFLIVQALIGLLVLLQFNRFTIWLGISSLVLVAIYPFMKRFTYWPQFFLGLAFNWGVLVGYAAQVQTLSVAAWLFYLAGIFWTLGYDTIYAHQDREDDALIGVKSSALALADHSRLTIALFYIAMMVCMLAGGYLHSFGIYFYVALAFAALHLGWQVIRLNIHDGALCLQIFKSNRLCGLLIVLALAAGQL